MQTFLDGAPDRLRCNAVLFVVIHLLSAAVFGDRHQRLHALRDLIGEKHYFAVYMPRGTTRGLDEGGLAAQETFLVRIQNADQGNFGKIETFTKQIDSDENVEIGCAKAAQDFHALTAKFDRIIDLMLQRL